MSTISNDYSFPIQKCQNCVHQTQHYTFLTKTSQNCAHQMSTISITTHLLYKQAKIAFTKCPLYQSLRIYHTNKPKLRPLNKSLHFYYAKKVIRRVLNPH